MSISVKPYTQNFSNQANSAIGKVWDRLPSITVNNKKVIKGIHWIGKHISSPENRLILGVSALMSQPFIDLHNKRVDEDTRKSSAARTVAKIIAGTTTGVFVRWGSIKLIDKMAKVPLKYGKRGYWETFFSPDRARVAAKGLKAFKDLLGNYKKTIGTYLSLAVMVFTNFAIDAPLTKFLTNKFISKIKKNDNQKNNTNAQTPAPAYAGEFKNNSTNLIKNKIEELQNLSNNNNMGGAA